MKGLSHLVLLLFFVLAVWVGLSACAKKEKEHILSRKEMVKIMEEMYIAEEKVNHLALSRDSSKKVFEIISARVFESAAVTDSVFKRSFDYYMERPKEMELIYTALVDTLQLREQRAPYRPDKQ